MEELKANTARLIKEVSGLRQDVTALDKDFAKYKKSARDKTITFIILLVMVAAAAGIAIGAVVEQRNLSERVWCPFFQLVVSGYNPDGPAAKAQGIDQYERNFVELRRQYAALDCGEPR